MRPSTKDVLLVVDVQNDFCPGGALPVASGDQVIAPILRLAAHFEHVLLTQDWHPANHTSFAANHEGKRPYETIRLHYGRQTLWPVHCVQGSRGAAFHPALHLPQAELILRKGFRPEIDSYSAFFENDRATPTGLAGYLGRSPAEPCFSCRPGLRFLCRVLRAGRAAVRDTGGGGSRRLPGHRSERFSRGHGGRVSKRRGRGDGQCGAFGVSVNNSL